MMMMMMVPAARRDRRCLWGGGAGPKQLEVANLRRQSVDSDPNSPEFQAAYHAALPGEKTNAVLGAVAARGGSGTVGNAISSYLGSTSFNDGSSRGTQERRRPILKSFLRPEIVTLPLAKMDEPYLRRWLQTASTLGVQKTWLNSVRPFFKWAVEDVKLIEVDPTSGIRLKTVEGRGHHTWTREEIERYRTHHPIGTMARLALELLLTVTARRGDGISLGRQHVRDGWLHFVQEKNRKHKPVTVEMPIPPTLAAAIEACPSPPEALTFLTNSLGRPFGKKNFNDTFRAWCDEAGLPKHCVPHGLRKGGSKLMADSGCTPHEIMAVTGHKTMKEILRYTDAYDRKHAAVRAQAKVAAAKDNVVPLAVAAKR
jgi:integrase